MWEGEGGEFYAIHSKHRALHCDPRNPIIKSRVFESEINEKC